MVLNPAQIRARGDATVEQRGELRTLLDEKAVDDLWRQRFYQEVQRARGLSRTAAGEALVYLRSLAPKGDQPPYATAGQAEALRGLIRSRIVPTPLARSFTTRHAAGELTYIEADRAIREWLRLPLKAYDGVQPGAAGDLADGYYTVAQPDGTTRCYRIQAEPASGHRIVDQITGERRSQRRRIGGYQATQIIRAVAADTEAAARLYGETRHRCSACNQHLRDTTQPGYPHGFGRDCWGARQQLTGSAGAAQ